MFCIIFFSKIRPFFKENDLPKGASHTVHMGGISLQTDWITLGLNIRKTVCEHVPIYQAFTVDDNCKFSIRC